MKTTIVIKTGNGKRSTKQDYKFAVAELFEIIDRIDWSLKDKSIISFTPLKDGVRMMAK